MPDNLRQIVEHCAPFVVAAHQGQGPQLNIPRILEAVLIAAIVGAGTWFMTIPELKTEFKYIKADIQEVSAEVKAVQSDVNKLKTDVAVERARHSSASN